MILFYKGKQKLLRHAVTIIAFTDDWIITYVFAQVPDWFEMPPRQILLRTFREEQEFPVMGLRSGFFE